MTQQSENAELFELLNEDRDDFPFLVQKYRVNLASELRHSDLSGVDFGYLKTETIDLTGSILIDADLSRVECSRLILTEADTRGAKLPTDYVPGESLAMPKSRFVTPLQAALFAIRSFQSSSSYSNEFVKSLADSAAPSLGLYSTAAEQDYLTRRVILETGASWTPVADNEVEQTPIAEPIAPVMWLYTRRAAFDKRLLQAHLLDAAIIKLAEESEVSHPDLNPGINLDLIARNQQRIRRLQANISDINDPQRKMNRFIASFEGAAFHTLLLSGFPPMSRRMYNQIRDKAPRLKFIFLCPGVIEQWLKTLTGNARHDVVPRHPFEPKQTVTEEDLVTLSTRIRTASNGIVRISRQTLSQLINPDESGLYPSLRTPLTSIALPKAKKMLSEKIEAAARRTPRGKTITL